MCARFTFVAGVVTLAILASACAPAAAPTQIPGSGIAPHFILTSNAFTEGANIPSQFTCGGEGISPELKWDGAPASAKSFVLIVDDPDAPGGTFTHWVVFDIPASQTEIAAGVTNVGKSGQNSARRNGYTGPCPPSGTHRYFFTLYALDLNTLGLKDGASRADVEMAMKLHTLAVTQLIGRYSK